LSPVPTDSTLTTPATDPPSAQPLSTLHTYTRCPKPLTHLCHLPTQPIIKTHPNSPSLLLLHYHLISLPYTPTLP
jgi:hypothetical protein